MSSPHFPKILVALCVLLLCGSVNVPVVAGAELPEEGKVLVAVVLSADLPRYRQAYDAFLAGLDSRPTLRRRLKLFVQTPNPDPFSWENSIRRAAAAGADLLLTFGTPATLAARKAAPRLPTLYCDVYDPLRLGVEKAVHSFEDDIAGISSRLPMTTLVHTLRQIAPVRRMGALFSRHERGTVLQAEELKRLSAKTGYKLFAEDLHSDHGLDQALRSLATADIDVMYLTESAVVGRQVGKILAWCDERQIPVIGHVPGLAQDGAILCLEADPAEQGEVLARCVIELASGADNACRGIRKARKINFLVNLSVAEKYGLIVPFQALTLATHVLRGENAADNANQ